MSKPRIILRQSNLFLASHVPDIDLMLPVDASFPRADELQLLAGETQLAVRIEQIEPFPVGKKTPRSYWRYHRLVPVRPLHTGSHLFTVRWLSQGEVIDERRQRIKIDLAPPFIEFLSPAELSFVSPHEGAEVAMGDERTSDALLRSSADLAAVGAAKAAYLEEIGISRIADLLRLSLAIAHSSKIPQRELLNIVTRARLADRFRFNIKLFESMLDTALSGLVFRSEEQVRQQTGAKPNVVHRFVNDVRVVHSCFDLNVTQELTLRDFIKRPPSRVAAFELWLDNIDVSAQAQMTKDRIVYAPNASHPDGSHVLRAVIRDRAGNMREASRHFYVDATAPTIEIASPRMGMYYSADSIPLDAQVFDVGSGVEAGSLQLFLNDQNWSERLRYEPAGVRASLTELPEGPQTLRLIARDRAGNEAAREVQFYVDQTAPVVLLEEPADGMATESVTVSLRGRIEDVEVAEARIGAVALALEDDGSFTQEVPLELGLNQIQVEAVDLAGNRSVSPVLSVYRLNPTAAGYAGTVLTPAGEAAANVELREAKSGAVALTDGHGRFRFGDLPEGELQLTVRSPDSAHATATVTFRATYGRTITRTSPIRLLTVARPEKMVVEQSGNETVIRNPDVAGLALYHSTDIEFDLPPDTAPGIFIDLIDGENLPYDLPDFVPAGKLVRLEPAGLRVKNGATIRLVLPNLPGADAGQQLMLLSYDASRGRWSTGGMARVSDDGAQIETLEGMGLRHFSLAVPLPPLANFEVLDEAHMQGAGDGLKGGLRVTLPLPGFTDSGLEHVPTMIYSSLTAAPQVRVAAIFRGLQEIAEVRPVADFLAIDVDQRGLRILPRYTYDTYQVYRRIYDPDYPPNPNHYSLRPMNEYLYSNTVELPPLFIPAGGSEPTVPAPENVYFHELESRPVADRTAVREVTFYRIKIRNRIERGMGVWPESITTRCWFSDQDSGDFTVHGPLTKIGPEPRPGEEDARAEYPRMSSDTLLEFSMQPRGSSGAYYPTGLYNFFAKYQVSGRSYRMTRSAVIAEQFQSGDWLQSVYENLARKAGVTPYYHAEGHHVIGVARLVPAIRELLYIASDAERIDLSNLLETLEQGSDLFWNGPDYESRFEYGDPLGLLLKHGGGSVIVHNLVDSNFGRGWRFGEVQEVHRIGSNRALVIDDAGGHVFTVADRIQKIRTGHYGMLGRNTDGTVLAAVTLPQGDWLPDIDALSRHGDVVGTIIFDIVSSQAYRELFPTDTEFVAGVFRACVGREPTVKEAGQLGQQLARHIAWFIRELHESDAFRDAFASNMVELLLDRPATPQEARELGALAEVPSNTYFAGENVIIAILTGEEFTEQHTSDEAWIDAVFARMTLDWRSLENRADYLSSYLGYLVKNTRADFVERIVVRRGPTQYMFARDYMKRILNQEPFRAYGIHLLRGRDVEMQPGALSSAVTTVMTGRYRQTRFSPSHSFHASPAAQLLETLSFETPENITPTPSGIAFGGDKVYVSDAATHRIYQVPVAASGMPTMGFASASILLGTAARNNSNELVGEYRYFDANGNHVKSSVNDIAAGQETHILSREYTLRRRQSNGGGVTSGFSPDGVYASEGPYGNQIAEPVTLHAPGGLVLDDEGRIIFAETGNHRVRRFDPISRELVTLVGTGLAEYRPGLYDRQPVNLRAPLDLARSRAGDLYILFHPVGDQQAVARFDRNGRFTHIAGSPYQDVGTIDVGVDAKFFKLLGAVAIEVNEREELVILLRDQARVLVVTREGYIDAIAGDATASDLTGDGGPALQASLDSPRGMTTDFAGNVIIADTGHHSLRMLSSAINDGHVETEFIGPRGHYDSRLMRRRDGAWERRYKNGTVAHFNDRGRQTALVDRNMNRTEYEFYGEHLAQIRYPGGSQLDFEYNDGLIAAIIDHAGRRTEFVLEDGRLLSSTQADGSLLTLNYDDEARLTGVNGAGGKELRFSYDDEGRLASGENDLRLSPPVDGARIAATPDRGLTLSIEESATRMTGSGFEDLSYKVEHGRLAEYRHGDLSLRILYNAGLLPIRIERGEGSFIELEYNDAGDLLRMRDTFLDAEREMTMNASGLPISERDYAGHTRHLAYDDRGNLVRTHKGDRLILEHKRNEDGQLIARESMGVRREFAYDSRANFIGETGHSRLELDRDDRGNVSRERTGDAYEREYVYDVWNRLLEVKETRGSTRYELDDHGRITAVIAPNDDRHEYAYDSHGNLTTLTFPGARVWRFAYDGQRRMTEKTAPGGDTTAYEYFQSTYQEETTANEFIERWYSIDGLLLRARNGEIEVSRQIDEVGRFVREEFYFDEEVPTDVEREYDADGRLLILRSLDQEIQYNYDEYGWFRGTQTESFQFELTRDANGRTHRYGAPHGLAFEVSHAPTGAVERIVARFGDQTLYSSAIELDAAGNISSYTIDDYSAAFAYDGNEQLISEDDGATIRVCDYGPTGDRTRYHDGDYVYNAGGFLAEDPRYIYEYDEYGRVSQKTTKDAVRSIHFEYNHRGQLRAYWVEDGGETPALEAAYAYDALGRRIAKHVASRGETELEFLRYFLYDRDELLLELDSEFNLVRLYIPGLEIDGQLGFVENGRAYYYGRDPLGNIVQVLDQDGAVVCRYRYDAFGNLLEESEGIENPLRYRGREWDAESATYYYRHRTYDPAIGRFLQPDPAHGKPDRPLSMFNRYAYAWNNPLRYSDPLGLHPDGRGGPTRPPREVEVQPRPSIDHRQRHDERNGLPWEDVPAPTSSFDWSFLDSFWSDDTLPVNSAPRRASPSNNSLRERAWQQQVGSFILEHQRLLAGGPAALYEQFDRNLQGISGMMTGLTIPAGGAMLSAGGLNDSYGGASTVPPPVFIQNPVAALGANMASLNTPGVSARTEAETKVKELDTALRQIDVNPGDPMMSGIEREKLLKKNWPKILTKVRELQKVFKQLKKGASFRPFDEALASKLEFAYQQYLELSDDPIKKKSQDYANLSSELLSADRLTNFLPAAELESVSTDIKNKLKNIKYYLFPPELFEVWYMLQNRSNDTFYYTNNAGDRVFPANGLYKPSSNKVYIRNRPSFALEKFEHYIEADKIASRRLLETYIHETLHAITEGNATRASYRKWKEGLPPKSRTESARITLDGRDILGEALDSYFTRRLVNSTRYGWPKPKEAPTPYSDFVIEWDELLSEVDKENDESREQIEQQLFSRFLKREDILDIVQHFKGELLGNTTEDVRIFLIKMAEKEQSWRDQD